LADPRFPLIELQEVKSVEDVVATFDEIIEWSINAYTPIGYFAVIYRQATVAIHDAIKQGKFTDADRMVQFQLIFARRYFTALNAYNGHRRFQMPTHVWHQSFTANAKDEPIVFQHLLVGLNAHMNLDLGVAAATVGRGSMPTLRRDFNVVNAVLGYQVEGVLDAVAEISPVIRRMRECMVGEVEMFRGLIVVFRELAWRFATDLAEASEGMNVEQIELHDGRFVRLGQRYVYTPDMFDFLIRRIAVQEDRDVAKNIRVLKQMSAPAGWNQICEYDNQLDEAATARAVPTDRDDDDNFFERCARELREKALGLVRLIDG
jgi:hypothetical protein